MTDPSQVLPPPELVAYLEGLPEPHILFDRGYRIAAANAAYRRQFGESGDGSQLLGRRCHEVSHHIAVPCDQAGERCPMAAALASGQRERVLHLHHTPQGEAYVDIELVPLAGPAPGEAPRWFIEKMQPLRVAQGQPAAAGLIGRSPAFRALLGLVARVAPSQASVLLLGESGTGKELLARAVHEASPRAGRPLVVVDCASLPESLFESELFGHERGAFTGAHAAHAGLVAAADGGTLFLDEVGDIPLSMQVKLLRLLETGTWRRVGSTELRHADLRWVAATHRDLPAMVAEGRFREDLFHRLASFPIRVPALRERREDIALLAAALLARLAPQRQVLLAPAALARLQGHGFAGNVRELRNVLERALLLGDGNRIGAELIEQALALGRFDPAPGAVAATAGTSAGPPASGLRDLEQQAGHQALLAAIAAHPEGRQAQAQALGISLRTLHRRLRELPAPPSRG
ncbi:MAG: sigma-54-dependent Fis family transcriptional regulator [Burkholderiaceae bacterium]|nr:sigma-54-dependent Fis family transcriptional regulator [Burkholderiaceae bacterium]